MPADFLLPLFVVTLLANAILVAFAIRGMRRGRFDPDGPIARPWPAIRDGTLNSAANRPGVTAADDPQRMTAVLARAVAERRAVDSAPPDASLAAPPGALVATEPDDPAPAEPDDPAPAEPAGSTLAEADDPGPGEPGASAMAEPTEPFVSLPAEAIDPVEPLAAVAPPVAEPPRRRRAARGATSATGAEPRPRAAHGGGRRRFSLPPLDDDHERVSRSIESFLGGADAVGATAASSPEAAPGTAASSRDAAPGIATTVALVVVDGLPDAAALDRPAPIDETATEPSPDTAEVADALAMVERTLRGAARGSDVITTRGLGAFRIVLPSTGEHAAHAYLRRVRATIEPRLHAAERPLRLAVATATALDEPLEDVVRRAEGRLATALDAVRSPAPRARGPRDGGEPSGSDVDQVADQSPQLDDRATRALAAGADVD